MNIIYKFPVHLAPFSLVLPAGAKILDVQVQDERPQFWVLMDPAAPCIFRRNFVVLGTGHTLEEDSTQLVHIGTFQMHGGTFVGHLFEVKG